ncbi:MAG: hypothetical protein ACYTGQ_18885 [Planctomycetota bacterium]|jgi:hypothetical protein
MDNNPANLSPIVMQWDETVDGGKRHWHIARLREDASFWGYVHIRTESLTENQSFDGSLSLGEYDRVQALLKTLQEAPDHPHPHHRRDGYIGVGTGVKSDVLVAFYADRADEQDALVFLEIVALLQPRVTAAAGLE